jgi:hypothetical protein
MSRNLRPDYLVKAFLSTAVALIVGSCGDGNKNKPLPNQGGENGNTRPWNLMENPTPSRLPLAPEPITTINTNSPHQGK